MNFSLLVAAAFLPSFQAPAAELRKEFFARVRDCERTAMVPPPMWNRTAALGRIEKARELHEAGDFAGACMELCIASAHSSALPSDQQWAVADGLSFALERQLLDVTTRDIDVSWRTLRPMKSYTDWAPSHGVSADQARPYSRHAGEVIGFRPWPDRTASATWNAPLHVEREGDPIFLFELWDVDFTSFEREVVLSFVDRRDERLAALSSAIEAAREKGPRLEVDSAEMLRVLLESLARGSTEAHDYPGARLLAEAEQVVAAAAKGERWYGPQRDGEFWLALPIGATSVRTRVFVPSGHSKEKPATLVIALHGRSFDEDTWFDGYGGGQSVELARKRGWLLAAPRCDGNEDAAKLAAITAALADVYPIDMSRVLLVGHSRGGGSALNAVAQAPDRFRAVATIGSALEPARASSLDKRPLFLAAGDHDFAREGVEALHKALAESGATNTTFKLYPNTEHWLCVTDALPDVFTWFDAQLRDGSGDLRAK